MDILLETNAVIGWPVTVKFPVVHGTVFDRVQSIDIRQCLLMLGGAILDSVGFIPTYTGIQ